jgi:hypothetical protein
MLYNIAKSSKPRNFSKVYQKYNSNISAKENHDYENINYEFSYVNFESTNNFRLSHHIIFKEESILPLIAGASDKLTGLPLNNVSFIFIPIKENNNTIIEKETVCKGQFLVKFMEEGFYKVYVKKSGYIEQSFDLAIKNNLTAFIEVELEKE